MNDPLLSPGKAIVVEAMKRAVEQGKQYWSYVEAIPVKREMLQVQGCEGCEGERVSAHVRESKAHSGGRKPVRNEKLPDWFTEEGVVEIPSLTRSLNGEGKVDYEA